MWQVDNRTPFAAERAWIRGRDGSEIWLVAVRATFEFGTGGSCALAPTQLPVVRAPVHHGAPGFSSLRYESDFMLSKQHTDITLIGHAHAPAGRSLTHLLATLRVGPMRKQLLVQGNRRWGRSGATAAEPFEKMPLQYERAFGGGQLPSAGQAGDWDVRNPVGVGCYATAALAADRALPNVEQAQAPIEHWSDRPAPAGFGPLAAHWQPRASFAGTYDKTWQRTRAPLWAADMDERFFQSAPADQQAPGFLQGGEAVHLDNLHPAGAVQFNLPAVQLGLLTHFLDASPQAHAPARLHSVILEPDESRISMVWHSALPCHPQVHQLERTVVVLDTVRGVAGAA